MAKSKPTVRDLAVSYVQALNLGINGLKMYGKHKPYCFMAPENKKHSDMCDCGLKASIDRLEAARSKR